ncbi:hypothetical protein ACFQY0_01890 [Haloferula chungangensis]|uniref:DUF2269 family protein n=1 Tax=Haloferula chungangensis TaxID=1048331 RepID=A0ABW2L3Q1_9BACT
MDEPSPYQSPASSGMPSMPLEGAESGAAQAFGVIHIIFGVFGILIGVWNVVGVYLSESMNGIAMPAGPERERLLEVQQRYLAEVGWVSIMTGIFILVLSVLLLISGPKLWKKKASGLRWSNRYAWMSIATKLVSIVVGLLVVLPASREMTEALIKDMAGSSDTMAGFMSVGSSLGVLLGPIFGMVYPVLALILLNRPSVTRFLQD